jgi:hypothetical protein
MPSHAEEGGGFRFSTDAEIQQVMPKKPVRIKLKRKEDGTYAWELVGSDPDEVISVDRKLREYLKKMK